MRPAHIFWGRIGLSRWAAGKMAIPTQIRGGESGNKVKRVVELREHNYLVMKSELEVSSVKQRSAEHRRCGERIPSYSSVGSLAFLALNTPDSHDIVASH